ncbi:MAG: Tetratricopeptide 3 repeat-containing protein [Ignavibacteria bacterium]|nr:Tetratricopeptide 3 repeat-containing protein [Ignavibacteria bacterium]
MILTRKFIWNSGKFLIIKLFFLTFAITLNVGFSISYCYVIPAKKNEVNIEKWQECHWQRSEESSKDFGSGFFTSLPMTFCQDDISLTNDFADYLYERGSYNDAITEYLRVVCFCKDVVTIANAYYKAGLCYIEMGLWEKAHSAFRKAGSYDVNDTLLTKIKLSDVTASIAEGNIDNAQIELLTVINSIQIESLKEEAGLILITSSIIQQNFPKTKKFIKDFGSYINNPKLIKNIDSILSDVLKHEKKSPIKAKWLSSFLPGLGQFYAGEYGSSANAFLLNSLNFFATGLFIYYGEYGNALLYFAFLTERYYSGNRYQAEQSVIRLENKISSEYTEKLLQIIRNR